MTGAGTAPDPDPTAIAALPTAPFDAPAGGVSGRPGEGVPWRDRFQSKGIVAS